MSRIIVTFIGCWCLSGCMIVQVGVTNPMPELTTVAVAPFFNLGAERAADGRRLAELYASELQKIPGVEVVPVGVVETTMRENGLTQLSGPADALKIAELLNADAVVIGSITEFKPYYPPRLGLSVAWYSRYHSQSLPMPLDPLARQRLKDTVDEVHGLGVRRHLHRRANRLSAIADGLMLDNRYTNGWEPFLGDFKPVEKHDHSPRDRRIGTTGASAGSHPKGGGASKTTPQTTPPGTSKSPKRIGSSPQSGSSGAGNGSHGNSNLWNLDGHSDGRSEVDYPCHENPPPQRGLPPAPPSEAAVPVPPLPVSFPGDDSVTGSTQKTTIRGQSPRPSTHRTSTDNGLQRWPLTGSSYPRTSSRPSPREFAAKPISIQHVANEDASQSVRTADITAEDRRSDPAPPRLQIPMEQPAAIARAPRVSPIMSYTRVFDASDSDLVAIWRDHLETTGDQRTGDWVARLYWSDNFLRFTTKLMITEMFQLHGGEAKRRIIFKLRKHR